MLPATPGRPGSLGCPPLCTPRSCIAPQPSPCSSVPLPTSAPSPLSALPTAPPSPPRPRALSPLLPHFPSLKEQGERAPCPIPHTLLSLVPHTLLSLVPAYSQWAERPTVTTTVTTTHPGVAVWRSLSGGEEGWAQQGGQPGLLSPEMPPLPLSSLSGGSPGLSFAGRLGCPAAEAGAPPHRGEGHPVSCFRWKGPSTIPTPPSGPPLSEEELLCRRSLFLPSRSSSAGNTEELARGRAWAPRSLPLTGNRPLSEERGPIHQCRVPGLVLGAGDTAVNRTPAPPSLVSHSGRGQPGRVCRGNHYGSSEELGGGGGCRAQGRPQGVAEVGPAEQGWRS